MNAPGLSNTDNASVSLRKSCCWKATTCTPFWMPRRHVSRSGSQDGGAVLRERVPTRKIWYYQLDPGRSMGKTNPLNDDDLAEFVKLQKTLADSPNSWTVEARTIDQTTFDLSVRTPTEPGK